MLAVRIPFPMQHADAAAVLLSYLKDVDSGVQALAQAR